MRKEEFLEKIKSKPIYEIKSIYAYFLDFEIGEPYLKIDELQKTTGRFRRYDDKLKFDQVYYDAKIEGEIHFSTEAFWKLKMRNKVICDANTDHSEIEYILNFLLTGHSIKDIEIVKDKRNIVKILFSNNLKKEARCAIRGTPLRSWLGASHNIRYALHRKDARLAYAFTLCALWVYPIFNYSIYLPTNLAPIALKEALINPNAD